MSALTEVLLEKINQLLADLAEAEATGNDGRILKLKQEMASLSRSLAEANQHLEGKALLKG